MHRKWSKIGALAKVVPVNESIDQPMIVLNDPITRQQNNGSLNVIRKQPISNITDYPKQNHEQLVVDEAINQRIGSGTSVKYSLSSRHNPDQNDSIDDDIISASKASVVDATISALSTVTNDRVEIVDVNQEAFNDLFIQQRQQAIDNPSYRSTVESWRPKSFQHLTDTIKSFSRGKSFVDQYWIIFYWIACNIEYDTVSYFANNYKDQSAQEVFRRRKGVCAGYANLYKYLCDQLRMPCEIVSGYSKGYGFDEREEAPTEVDHAWNAVQMNGHWYLIESTWGAGHLDDRKEFNRELTSYYFLPRPNEMIYHHSPEDGQWQFLRRPIDIAQYM